MKKQLGLVFRTISITSALILTACISESVNPSTGSVEYSGRGQLELDSGLTFKGLLENASSGLIHVLAEGIPPNECREIDYDLSVMENGKLKRTRVDGETCRKSKE
jgi:hypothetical protein